MDRQRDAQTAPNTTENRATPKRRRGRGAMLALLFVVVCLALTLTLNDVLRQKWNYSHNAAQQIVRGYYAQPANSIDVLCLGASTIRNGVSALEMFKQYGFTTYSRATSVQLPILSYSLLQETLETQDIKAVVMDAMVLTNLIIDKDLSAMAGKMHEAIDYMPWSKYKWNMIQECVKMNPAASKMEFILPLYAYHDRWFELLPDDFTYRGWQDDYCYHGQFPSVKTSSCSFAKDFMSPEAEDPTPFYLEEGLTDYCAQMIDFCKARGIEFVLMKTPSLTWSAKRHDIVEAFAEAQGVTFIDYNDLALLEEIGFNPKTDFADSSSHPNVTGAKKLSGYLGKYLSQVCDFTDKRQDPAYQSWYEDLEKYEYLLEDAEFARQSDLLEYLAGLDNPNYITLIATRNDTQRYFNRYVAKAFQRLGIDVPFDQYENMSFAAVLDGGVPVVIEADEDQTDDVELVSYTGEVDGHSIAITSLAGNFATDATMTFDGELLSTSTRGFNFAVYDRRVNQIISQKGFNTGVQGKNYLPEDPYEAAASDPLRYLELLQDEDTIAVLAVSAAGSRYMPGVANDKLIEMGLLPLDREADRPYIAVLNGGEVVYNEYGEPQTRLDVQLDVDGVPVTAISDLRTSKRRALLSIGDSEHTQNKKAGLLIMAYSKSEAAEIAFKRFDWSDNYLSARKLKGGEDPLELLTIARNNGYDAVCLYGGSAGQSEVDPQTLALLAEYGFTQLPGAACYAGVVRADGRVEQTASAQAVIGEYALDGASLRLRMSAEGGEALFDAVPYAAEAPGLYVLLYDPAVRAVLTMKDYTLEAEG